MFVTVTVTVTPSSARRELANKQVQRRARKRETDFMRESRMSKGRKGFGF
jgi:hypothetical protein